MTPAPRTIEQIVRDIASLSSEFDGTLGSQLDALASELRALAARMPGWTVADPKRPETWPAEDGDGVLLEAEYFGQPARGRAWHAYVDRKRARSEIAVSREHRVLRDFRWMPWPTHPAAAREAEAPHVD